jgi:hypothetical protein
VAAVTWCKKDRWNMFFLQQFDHRVMGILIEFWRSVYIEVKNQMWRYMWRYGQIHLVFLEKKLDTPPFWTVQMKICPVHGTCQ